MIFMHALIATLHLFADLIAAKFAFEHWGFWAIFPAFPVTILVFYVVYQACINAAGWIELKLRRAK